MEQGDLDRALQEYGDLCKNCTDKQFTAANVVMFTPGLGMADYMSDLEFSNQVASMTADALKLEQHEKLLAAAKLSEEQRQQVFGKLVEILEANRSKRMVVFSVARVCQSLGLIRIVEIQPVQRPTLVLNKPAEPRPPKFNQKKGPWDSKKSHPR